MRSDIRVILIFALHPLRDLIKTEIFVPKSYKIAKLLHLTMQNIFCNFTILNDLGIFLFAPRGSISDPNSQKC